MSEERGGLRFLSPRPVGTGVSFFPTAEMLRHILEHSPTGLFIRDPLGCILDCNRAFCRLMKCSREELLQMRADRLLSFDEEREASSLWREDGDGAFDVKLVLGDGGVCPVHMDTHVLSVGRERLLVVYVRDQTDFREMEEELRRQAFTDGLTGVWNRTFFQGRLLEEMERVRRYGSSLSLVMFDIDGFKRFNDRFGHLCGDRALKRLASLVRRRIRVSDCFSRWGGDEFMILSPVPLMSAMSFAERLLQELRQASWPHEMKVSLSMGVVEFTGGNLAAEVFLDRVDQAMYRAKRSGGDRVCPWTAPVMPEGS